MNQIVKLAYVVAVIGAIFIFICGVITIPLLAYYYDVNQYEKIFALFGAIISLVTLAIVVASIGFAVKQINEASNTRMLSALPHVFSERIHNPTSATARRKLYYAHYFNPNSFKLPLTGLTDDLLGCCQQVFYDYSELGSFIHYGLLDKKYAEDVLHANPARMWYILKDYAKAEAKQRGYEDYIIPFKRIAVIGIEYWLKAQHYEGKDELYVYSRSYAKSEPITRPELCKELSKLKKEIKDYESYKSKSERKLHFLTDRGERIDKILTASLVAILVPLILFEEILRGILTLIVYLLSLLPPGRHPSQGSP